MEKSVAGYIVGIVQATREEPQLKLGVSPRGSLMLFRAAQAVALLRGRDFVLPDDVQELASNVLAHRVILTSKAKYSGAQKHDVIRDILTAVKVPT
jgi:MoxR-like ATPase